MPDAPLPPTPADRLRDLAEVLAAALIRLRDRHSLVDRAPPELSENQTNELATPGAASLTVHPG